MICNVHVVIKHFDKRQETKFILNTMRKPNYNGMAKSLSDASVQIDEVQKELWEIYRNSYDENRRIKILNSIANLTIKKKELFMTTKQDVS